MTEAIFAADLFAGKRVLITGAAGGVGAATARLLASLGARLALSDHAAPALATIAAETGALPLCGDLRDTGFAKDLPEAAARGLGGLDGLVLAAGVWVEGESHLASEEDWDLCLSVNLKAAFFTLSRAMPHLITSQGGVVAIASDAGVVGNAGAAIYCASKGGLVLMVRAMAREYAPQGVRINALCPSDIHSPMLEHQARTYGGTDPQAYFRRLLNHYPQGQSARFLTPQEVAQNVAFLLTPAASGITGAAMMLDFGLTAGY